MTPRQKDGGDDHIVELVKRDCDQGADCNWPKCGCDPQIFAQDALLSHRAKAGDL